MASVTGIEDVAVAINDGSSKNGSVVDAKVEAKGNGGGAKGTAPIVKLGSKPTLIVHSPLKFLIMDSPKKENLHLYIKECKRHGVTDLVRVCSPSYSAKEMELAGISVHEMAYADGTRPPDDVIKQFLGVVKSRFVEGGGGAGAGAGADARGGDACIGVHCVAGLGRAPVLVAIALIEFGGCDPIVAVDFIRKHRRGAINAQQLDYLEQYTPTFNAGCVCSIM